MHLIGLARLGQDAVIRYTPDGQPVANLSLAFNYGRKDDQGKRKTQWIDASLWGERAQKLEPYLLKGTLLHVHLAEPHLETFQRTGGGEGTKIVAILNHLDLASSPNNDQQQGQQRQPQQRPQGQQQNTREQNRERQYSQGRPAANFSDMDDDIPF